MSLNLATKNIFVTGGSGFLGSFVVKKLKERGCKNIFVPRSKDYDLVQMSAVKKLYKDAKPEGVCTVLLKHVLSMVRPTRAADLWDSPGR